MVMDMVMLSKANSVVLARIIYVHSFVKTHLKTLEIAPFFFRFELSRNREK